MKTQAKVALGISILLVVGLFGYFLQVRKDDAATQERIDKTAAPVQAPGLESRTAQEILDEGVVLGERGSTKVVVTEFMDFECPFCREQQPLMHDLLTEFSGVATISVRPFPLDMHKNARQAWTAALAAGMQGKFGEMYKKLFATQSEWADSDDQSARFRKDAEALGLDMAAYDAAITSPVVTEVVGAAQQVAIDQGIKSTPTWLVNGKAVDAPDLLDAVRAAVEAEK